MGKVTRELLRQIEPGETMMFADLTAQDIYTGKSVAYQTGHLTGAKYSTRADFKAGTLRVTRTN